MTSPTPSPSIPTSPSVEYTDSETASEAGDSADTPRQQPTKREWATVATNHSQSPTADMVRTRHSAQQEEIDEQIGFMEGAVVSGGVEGQPARQGAFSSADDLSARNVVTSGERGNEDARVNHQEFLMRLEAEYNQIMAAYQTYRESPLHQETLQGTRPADDPEVRLFKAQLLERIAAIPHLQVRARVQYILFDHCHPQLAHLSVVDEHGQPPKLQARPWHPYPYNESSRARETEDMENDAQLYIEDAADGFAPVADEETRYTHPSQDIDGIAEEHGFDHSVEGLLRGNLELARNDDDYPNDELEDTVRLTNTAINVLESLRTNLPTAAGPSEAAQPVNNSKVMPTFQELAIGHIKAANPSSDDAEEHCTFCTYDSDFGVWNENVLLPEDASKGYCVECKHKTMGFMTEYTDMYNMGGDYYDTIQDFEQEHQIEQTNDLEELADDPDLVETAAEYQICEPTTHNTTSNLDGQDISRFRGIMFCRGNSMRQVDVTKARICKECQVEKMAIMNHRHREFSPAIRDEHTTDKNKRCMLCTGMAEETCDGCPLNLCFLCVIKVKKDGKGWTNNAIYSFGREHIRNDAFLLRSDGGGF
ncbi:hypothetical protein HYFRA_00011076 [Hymenoscyphus fraxineus]|uniref:Uncharacterized protein n=1 Tax=Hymenoscyphus fraxineus TaxID=746836 RepID=A0A9N9PLH8_9HELO|nr:hypothetical protein HYFRA_00011076 [Hymenoscyphus fraxineus]